MASIELTSDCREAVSRAFLDLAEKTVLAGMRQGDVALLLLDLAEAYLMKVSGEIIGEGAIQSHGIHDRLKN